MPDTAAERPRVYLNKVHLKGFKSIEDLTVDIQKGLNILIGKNGAGKSNFLEFIYQVIRYRNPIKILFNYSWLEFISADDHSFIIEKARTINTKAGKSNLYERIEDRPESSEKIFIDGVIAPDNFNDQPTRTLFQETNFQYSLPPGAIFYRLGYKHISPLFIKYDLPDTLGAIDLPGTLKAVIQDGAIYWNFPGTLNFVEALFWNLDQTFEFDVANSNDQIASDLNKFLKIPEEILDNLKKYTPIQDVCFNPNLNLYKDEKSLVIDNVKLDFKVNGNWLPWSQLSDGTRRLFYIISEVTHNSGIILIEEPELGIHPHQFSLLMDFLKEQAEDKQIIISTHSPKALDILSPEELNNILIAYYDKSKGTQIRHLTEPEKHKAKRYMKEVGFFSDYWLLSDLE